VSSTDYPSNRALAWLASVIVFVTLCFRLGHLPLLQPDEGRNAEVAREMKVAGAWLVPSYNGVDYLDKPAFYFKAVALSLAAFGDNETAARVPSAAFGVALVVMVFAFGRKVHSTRTGLLAAIVVGTTPLFLANSRTVIFDIALAFFVCGAIFAGYLAEEAEGRTRRNWYLLGAAAAGFATLVKGPVGFLIPALVLLVFQRIEGRRGVWKRLFAPVNLLGFFAVTLPWFVGLSFVHKDFLHYGLVEESFNRFTTAKKFHRSEPVYFFPLIILATFVPWSLLLPEAAVATWRERWAKHRADRLCIVWAVLVVVFFSISQSKLPGYILSVTVASGLLVARLLDAALADPAGRAGRIVSRATVVFGGLCLLLALVAVVGAKYIPSLAGPLRIPVADAAQLGRCAAPMIASLAAFGGCALLARLRRNAAMSFLCLALFAPLFVNVNLGVFDVIFGAKTARYLARELPALPPETELACLECFPNGLPFYLRRTATLITKDGDELTSNYILFGLAKPGAVWPKNLVPLAQFETWLAARKTAVYLIVRLEDRAKLESVAAARGVPVKTLPGEYLGALLPAPGGS
jgi:4-amino-4-deoxy-L-arabinose transferase-like glycosyltransferase